LWQRGKRFYVRMNLEGTDQRIALAADNVTEAKIEMSRLIARRADRTLRRAGRSRPFKEVVPEFLRQSELAKRQGTVQSERGHLNRFSARYGHLPLHKIDKRILLEYRNDGLAGGWSKRTANLALNIVQSLFRFAVDNGELSHMPCEPLRPLKHVSPRKRLYEWEKIEAVCKAAQARSRKGQRVADYIRLMCLCGARRDEALRLKWSDVDWARSQLVIGADGLAKNHHSRTVDFNPKLEAHLREMAKRKRPGTDWLFPAPRKGAGHIVTFMAAIWAARKKTGADDFAPHHCRVFFASQCVMAGIDFRTIAAWLGHRDGGVLLSRVYARLSDEHKRRAAARLEIG
jgi:integrase